MASTGFGVFFVVNMSILSNRPYHNEIITWEIIPLYRPYGRNDHWSGGVLIPHNAPYGKISMHFMVRSRWGANTSVHWRLFLRVYTWWTIMFRRIAYSVVTWSLFLLIGQPRFRKRCVRSRSPRLGVHPPPDGTGVRPTPRCGRT